MSSLADARPLGDALRIATIYEALERGMRTNASAPGGRRHPRLLSALEELDAWVGH